MLPAEPFDPYAPPRVIKATANSSERRRRGLEVVARVVGVILGFSLVADPTSLPGIKTALGQTLGGYVLARGVGLALLALAFLPWRWRENRERDAIGPARGDAEEL